jgi:hypothetical protein
METDLTQEREQAHTLLDSLDADQLAAVRHLLEVMVEPLARSLANAPVEDEEINDETAAALEEARASFRRGEGIPHEEILREFGLRS